MTIKAPPGSTIGGVKTEHTLLSVQGFLVTNGDGETVLKIVKCAVQLFSPEVDLR